MADKNTTSNINLAAAEELPKAQSKFKEFVKKFMKRKTAVISLAFIVFIILMAIIGPYVVPYDPQAPDYTAMMQGPSAAHIWGTNEYGQDVFSRLMVGTRLSLTCALTATIIGTAIGVVLGLIAGFYGGIIDALIMRCCDVLFAFPDILLAIAVVAIIGQGMVNVMIAVAVFTVPSFARIIRSATISVKQAPYVEVARSLGCSNTRILFVHIFPGTIQSMIVNFTMRVGTAILAEDSYSIDIPIGNYFNYSVYPTCGLSTTDNLIGEVDDPRYFAHPSHVDAKILWFGRGFIDYRIPNMLPPGQKIDRLTLSFEISSEAPGVNSDWPSDISFFLNNTKVGTWTSPGDFGDVHGMFTPDWWFPNWNQYGLLKMLVIDRHGTFIDGLKISDVNTQQLTFTSQDDMVFRFQVDEPSQNIGGLTLFGKDFGNYNQDINVKVHYTPNV